MEFWRYYRAVRMRWWVVAMLALIAVGSVGGYLLRLPPQFAASTRLLARQQPGTAQVLVFPAPDGGSLRADTTKSDILQIVLGPTMLRRIATRFPEGVIPGTITAGFVQGTSVLTITGRASTPETALRLADVATTEFLKYYGELNRADAAEARRFLQTQLGQTRVRLERAEARLAAFKRTHQLPALDQQVNAAVQSLAQLQLEREQAEVAAQSAGARIAAARRALQGQAATRLGSQTIVDNPVLVQTRTRLTELELRLNELTQIYTDRHPQVIGLRQEIAELHARLPQLATRVTGAEQVEPNPLHGAIMGTLIDQTVEYTAAKARRDALAAAITRMQSRLPSLSLAQPELASLTREQQVTEQTYLLLSAKLNEAIIKEQQAAYETASLRVVDMATAPATPVSRQLPIRMGLALLLGAMLGVGVALFVDYLDNTVRTPEQVEAAYGTPVVGVVPVISPEVYRQLTTLPRPAWATASLFLVVLVLAAGIVMLGMRLGLAKEAIELWAAISAI